jgi:hypothetical protein
MPATVKLRSSNDAMDVAPRRAMRYGLAGPREGWVLRQIDASV